jgi:hypothetical protein
MGTAGDQTPQVCVEFFGGYDPSLKVAAKAQSASFLPQDFATGRATATHSAARYIVRDRVYTRSSGELDLAAYRRIPLPGTDRRPHEQLFRPGSHLAFEVRTPDIGDITAARVWLANGGEPMSWRCETIAITCTQTMVKRAFRTQQHSSKGEFFTQKNTGKVLPAFVRVHGLDTQLHGSLSQLQPDRLPRASRDTAEPSRPRSRSAKPRSPSLPPTESDSDDAVLDPHESPQSNNSTSPGSSSTHAQGIWAHMVNTHHANQLPSDDVLQICELHNQDVQNNLDIVADGQDPPISLSELEKIVVNCTDDSGQVTIHTFIKTVRTEMYKNGCTKETVEVYFETGPVIPAWREEAWLHENAKYIYTITLRTGHKHKVRYVPCALHHHFALATCSFSFHAHLYSLGHRPDLKAEFTCSYWVWSMVRSARTASMCCQYWLLGGFSQWWKTRDGFQLSKQSASPTC